MATITNLPVDVIQEILNLNIISFQDFINFSSTCKHFYHMINNNTFWREKFYTSWPGLKKIYDEERHKGYVNFKEVARARLNCRKELRHFITKLSEKQLYSFYESLNEDTTWRTWLDKYRFERYTKKVFVEKKEIDALLHSSRTTHHLSYHLFMDELRSLYILSQSEHRTDLTYIYYGKELLPYMRHHYLKHVWQKFLNRPIEQRILEKAATLVAQWFKPEQDISYSYVATELQNIAQQVMERLNVVNPQHQIFSVSRKEISSWKSNNINNDQWNNSDTRQILDNLSEIFFEKQKFQGIRPADTDFCRNYLCINYVLKEKRGYVVPLAIVFQAVARRLGVYCDLLSFAAPEVSREDYWLLQWKPKCNVTNRDEQQCFYIDLLNGGAILNKNDWSRICEVAQYSISADRYSRINYVELAAYLGLSFADDFDDNYVYYLRSVRNEVLWFLELIDLLGQEARDVTMGALEAWKHHYGKLLVVCNSPRVQDEFITVRNVKRHIDFAQDIIITRSSSGTYRERFTPEPKKRTPEMRFAVGMIARNVRLDVPCVIIGWVNRNPWEIYPDSPDGCYYLVLCEEPEYQVILETIDTPEPINCDVIGRYFSAFNGKFYTPNEGLAKEYAEDVAYLTDHL